MQGARQYSELLTTEQVGRLYIVMGHHARGYTLQIFVLPEGEAALPNGPNNACLNSNAVEVYGVIAGQRGWTEEYGWLHRGPWCEDFQALVKDRAEKRLAKQQAQAANIKAVREAEEKRMRSLLSTYKASA